MGDGVNKRCDWFERAPTSSAGPDVIILVRGEGIGAHPGVVDAIATMHREGALRGAVVAAMDANKPPSRQQATWERTISAARERRTDAIILYHFHDHSLIDVRPQIHRFQSQPQRPVVALTNGDAFIGNFFRPDFPRMFLQAAQTADATFTTSMGRPADQLSKAGARVSLLPHAACQLRFGHHKSLPPRSPKFKVAFIGSNNRSKNPVNAFHWYARERERLVRKLARRYGRGFAVFGNGWRGIPGWQGPVPFHEQLSACRNAEVVVGGVPFSSARYYLSNRPFIQIASGVPFVDLAVEGVEKLLRDGDHWYLADSLDAVVARCDEVLSNPATERNDRAARAADYVLTHHTQLARLRWLIRELVALRDALVQGSLPRSPDQSFFLKEVNRRVEHRFSTRRWSDA